MSLIRTDQKESIRTIEFEKMRVIRDPSLGETCFFGQSQEGLANTNWVGGNKLLPFRPGRISQNALTFGKPVQSFALRDGRR
jgi:hypothetical protein